MLKLQFKDRRREAVWLVDQVFTIGKSANNSLMVDHAGVNEFHAEIINQHDQLTLVNKCDGIGVWVNGLPISDQTHISAGDSITLGELELELVDPKNSQTSAAKPKKKSSDWSISSKASWLDKSRYQILDKVIIGRDSACDIVLPLEHLSRQHVMLELRKGQLFVKDLDSANGTYLNGERVNEAPLKAGDKLKLDVVTFEVGGPTHDPHKTIIRTVANKEKTKLLDASATSSQAMNTKGHTPTSTKPANSPNTTTAAQAKAARVQKKKLAASGKQDWISGKDTEPENKPSQSGAVFVVIGIILVAAAVAVVLTQS